MKTIDLNADVGEGMATDEELLEIVSSANVCCGRHAGSPGISMLTASLARMRNAVPGAHPGLPDRPNFGRVEMEFQHAELTAELTYQIGGLVIIGLASLSPIRYIKPHGALYHMASKSRDVAGSISSVAQLLKLPVLGLPRSQLEIDCEANRVGFFREGFADRRYAPEGRLIPRDRPDAFIHDPSEAVDQIHRLIENPGIHSICIHGDNPDAVRFARTVRTRLEADGYRIAPFA